MTDYRKGFLDAMVLGANWLKENSSFAWCPDKMKQFVDYLTSEYNKLHD